MYERHDADANTIRPIRERPIRVRIDVAAVDEHHQTVQLQARELRERPRGIGLESIGAIREQLVVEIQVVVLRVEQPNTQIDALGRVQVVHLDVRLINRINQIRGDVNLVIAEIIGDDEERLAAQAEEGVVPQATGDKIRREVR